MSERTPDTEETKAAALMGAKGGRGGSGAKKQRSDEHYRVVLPKKRMIAKLMRQLDKA